MEDEQIKNKLSKLVERLRSENTKSKQFAFNRHIDEMENCFYEGVAQQKICNVVNEMSGCEIKIGTFKTMLSRARMAKAGQKPARGNKQKQTENLETKSKPISDNLLHNLSQKNTRVDYNPTPDKNKIYGD